MVSSSSGSKSLKEYLKRYENNEDEEKKKKKKKKKTKPDMSGVLIVDKDPVWQKPVQLVEDDESEEEEKPHVDEDIEVKRMKRLEQLKTRRPFGAISEDGSGWVSVSDTSKNLASDDINSDISPPRKRRARNDIPSPEPILERPTADDISPPRRHRQSTSPELRRRLPQNSTGRDVDISPPRNRKARFDTPSPEPDMKPEDPDPSPPRRGDHRLTYQSRSRASVVEPPRKTLDNTHRQSVSASVSDLFPPRKPMKDLNSLTKRHKTGLVGGKDIKEEIDKTKKEESLRFQNLDPSISGRNAQGVRRDKRTGQRLSKEQIKELQKQDEKPKEIKLEWGKGLAQKREADARLQELEREDKPFARTRDDTDLDNMLKDAVRWGDPMTHLVKKKQSTLVLRDIGDNEGMKESGFIVPQEIPNHSWLK